MIDYVYKAKNTQTGELVSADVQAESPEAAAKLLQQQNLFPLDITPKSQTDLFARFGLRKKVHAKDRVLFTRQLSTLINAGLPLARALHTVQAQIGHQAFRETISKVTASVEGGSSLSAAFSQHPEAFNEIYIALVAAGETSGTLDKTLLRLADQQEKDSQIVSKIRGALVYPAIVLLLVVGVVILMVTTVVPQVAKLYTDLHKTLPVATRILVGLAGFFTHFWWVALILLAAAIFGFRILLKQERTQVEIDKLQLRAPLFGILFKKLYMARFARTLGTMLTSGVPMIQSLEVTQRALTNKVLHSDMDGVIEDVRGGKALSDSIEKNAPHFLPLVPQMLKVGEESGAIGDMVNRVAVYFEDEVDEAVANLSSTLEPVMMVVLGGIVALVLAAVLGPVYGLVGSGDLSASH